ncbi:MAG TPA: hypothetical protein VHR15_09800 [Ktedonobacterales bacterium]|nr:hypothetical protein [Ktedonobacterales bacterium]
MERGHGTWPWNVSAVADRLREGREAPAPIVTSFVPALVAHSTNAGDRARR